LGGHGANGNNNNTVKRLYHKEHDNTGSDGEVETHGSPANSGGLLLDVLIVLLFGDHTVPVQRSGEWIDNMHSLVLGEAQSLVALNSHDVMPKALGA
jgi:hypothetical protein